MARPAGLVALASALVAVSQVAASGAGPGPGGPVAGGVNVEVVGACPGVDDVRRLLAQLLAPGGARDTQVLIQDRGPHYRIVLRTEATTFDDPGRDCAARARQAAVLVADDLRAHPPVPGPPRWTIEKGLVFDVSSGANGTMWAPGAEFRGAYGPGLWSIVGSAGARGPVTLSLQNDLKAELLRFPLDAGARVTSHRWRFRPWLGLAGSLTVTGILGQNLAQSDRVWRLDPGLLLLAGATLRVWRRIGVAAAINVRWQPRPYQLDVAPVGRVGETPVWWLGLSLNYTIDGEPGSP